MFSLRAAWHPVGQPQPRDDSTPASVWAAQTGVDGLLNKFLKDDMKSMGPGKSGVDLGERRGEELSESDKNALYGILKELIEYLK